MSRAWKTHTSPATCSSNSSGSGGITSSVGSSSSFSSSISSSIPFLGWKFNMDIDYILLYTLYIICLASSNTAVFDQIWCSHQEHTSITFGGVWLPPTSSAMFQREHISWISCETSSVDTQLQCQFHAILGLRGSFKHIILKHILQSKSQEALILNIPR